DRPRVTGDSPAVVNANVAAQRDRVAVDRTEHVEVAARDSNRTTDRRIGGDRAVADGEAARVGEAVVGLGATLFGLFRDRGGRRGGGGTRGRRIRLRLTGLC